MCGICGIVDYSGRPIEPTAVNRMRDAMFNRGPDDADTKLLPFVGLGHRRLSIIDLSPRGRNPMANEDGTIRIVFNGEIYNYEDLRPDLVRRGHVFRSQTDTEVIIHLYEELGAESIQRLNGMFAFALWDEGRRRLLPRGGSSSSTHLENGWCEP